MNIDKETIEKLAHLARLEFDEKEKAEMIEGMNRMLSFVDKLNELDTADVEPLIYMSEETNVLRPDVIKHEITQKEALQNAPKHDGYYFKAPKVKE